MPKTQKPKKTLRPLLNAAASVGKFVIACIPFAAVGLVVALVAAVILKTLASDRASDYADDLREKNANGADYELSDAHQVSTSDGSYIDYEINFRSQTVTIDGRDDADAVIQFADYKNKNFIEECREAGLSISNEILDVAEEDRAFADSKHTKDLFNDASVFQANYAEPLYDIAAATDTPVAATVDKPAP